jgi:hypothetical protein
MYNNKMNYYNSTVEETEPLNEQDIAEMLEEMKKNDPGYNKFYRYEIINQETGARKRIKVEFYTSGICGSNIRDAESGVNYTYTVGSAYEDLFFKVIMHNGICNSKNGSTTVFFTSPHQYMSTMGRELDNGIIERWEEKRNALLKVIESKKNMTMSDVVVR